MEEEALKFRDVPAVLAAKDTEVGRIEKEANARRASAPQCVTKLQAEVCCTADHAMQRWRTTGKWLL